MTRRTAQLLIVCTGLLLTRATTLGGDARRLEDLNPGAVGSYPSNLTAFAGQLFFSAYTLNTGIELWRWDGTNISLVADINNTADDTGGGVLEGNDSVPSWLTRFNNDLYFSAYSPRYGGELWRYDGTNVLRLTDIAQDQAPIATNSFPKSSWPNELTVFNGSLYFSATSSTNPLNYELWRYNTNTGATLVEDLHPNIGTNHSSYPNELKVFDGALYFMADDGEHDWELWRHTPTETTLIDINPGGAESSSYPKFFTAFTNRLFFQAYTASEGFEVWQTDGTNTSIVSDIVPGPDSSYPEFFTVWNGVLYFRGTDPAAGSELLKYDGNTVSVAVDVNNFDSSYPKNLLSYRGSLLFSADDGINGWELWKFDGTTASIVTNLNPSGDAFPENLTLSDGILYFTATTPETGYELWQYDGTNVTLAADLNAGRADSFPRFLTSMNRKLYFSAADTRSSNWELWMFDPGFTNQAPMVTLVSPTNSAVFTSGEPVTIVANATDEYEVISVEFFADDTSLWIDDSAPYTATNTFSAGEHTIVVRATDSSGAISTETVTVTVEDPIFEEPEIANVTRAGSTTTITLITPVTRTYTLQASSNLVDWIDVDSQVPVEGTVTLNHETNSEYLFYRAAVQP